MKKYMIIFTDDEMTPKLVDKWDGKWLTLQEVEDNIKELGSVIFNGRTIEIYNYYRE